MLTFSSNVLLHPPHVHSPKSHRMDNDTQPQNRKQRRATARNSTANPGPTPATRAPKIKLAHPDRSGPPLSQKTLVQLASSLGRSHGEDVTEPRIYEIGSDDDGGDDDGVENDEHSNIKARGSSSSSSSSSRKEKNTKPTKSPASAAASTPAVSAPFLESLFLTVCLAMLHFTLDVLVYSQYRQAFLWGAICVRTAKAVPLLFVIVHAFHVESRALVTVKGLVGKRVALGLRQMLFLTAAVVCGCYMVYSVHEQGYFAVMKRVPPVGTVWVWSVVEMRLEWALLSLGVVGGYVWWNGYSFY